MEKECHGVRKNQRERKGKRKHKDKKKERSFQRKWFREKGRVTASSRKRLS